MAGNLRQRIECIGMGGIVLQRLCVLRSRLRQRALPVERNGLRHDLGDGGRHGGLWLDQISGRRQHSAAVTIAPQAAIGSTLKLLGAWPRRCRSHMVR